MKIYISEHGEPGTRLRVRKAPPAGYPLAGVVEGATGYPRAGTPATEEETYDG